MTNLINCPNILCDRQDERETIESYGQCAWCEDIEGELDRAEEIVKLEEYDE